VVKFAISDHAPKNAQPYEEKQDSSKRTIEQLRANFFSDAVQRSQKSSAKQEVRPSPEAGVRRLARWEAQNQRRGL
jgi:hypothetical protein